MKLRLSLQRRESRTTKLHLSRILVVRTDRIGDLLMNVPVMRRLRQNYPKSRVTVLCHARSAESIRHQPDIDEVLAIHENELNQPKGKWYWCRRLKPYRFDAIVVSNPSKFFHSLAYGLRIPLRAGFSRKWGFLLNHSVRDQKAGSNAHEIDFNLSLLDSFCPEAWDRRLELGFEFHPKAKDLKEKFLKGLNKKPIVVNASSSNPEKSWPIDRFEKVIKELVRKTQHPVILVGDNPYLNLGSLEHEANFRNLTNQTSLSELALLIRGSQCVLSVDSAPYHLAWMQKVPTVGLFVTEAVGSNPQRWGAYPGFGKTIEIYKSRLDITQGEVLDYIYDCL